MRPAPATPTPARNTPVSFADMLRRLDWRTELLSLALVLAEASIVYLVAGYVLADTTSEALVGPAWIIGMLMLGAHFVPHLLDEWRVWSPQYEVITAATI